MKTYSRSEEMKQYQILWKSESMNSAAAADVDVSTLNRTFKRRGLNLQADAAEALINVLSRCVVSPRDESRGLEGLKAVKTLVLRRVLNRGGDIMMHRRGMR